MSKFEIKDIVEKMFKVHVVSVKTLNSKAEIKKSYTGRIKTVKAAKKAIVTLKEKEKIELFDTSEAKKKKK